MYARTLLLISIMTLSLHSQDHKNKPTQAQQTSNPDQRGTENSPLVVKQLIPPKTQEEAERDTTERNEKTANDRHVVQLTAALALIGFGQLLVYYYQARKLRQTVKAAGEQSKAMEKHIGEAARSANAMEEIADVIQSGNTSIMRAYLSVIIGTAVYQESQEGVKFEGKPSLVNTGSTPARNVRIWISARIMTTKEAETFDYPLGEESAKASAVAAPHQNYLLSAMVQNLVPDAEVPDIKHGRGKGLATWGRVTYDDIFGQSHTTRFGQWLFWYPNQSVYGYYIPGQNDMD
ncbi:MAG: hypothetical protein WA738_15210 [Candidatus Angelobacter sp.]